MESPAARRFRDLASREYPLTSGYSPCKGRATQQRARYGQQKMCKLFLRGPLARLVPILATACEAPPCPVLYQPCFAFIRPPTSDRLEKHGVVPQSDHVMVMLPS
jgi:hypothetical protein